MSSPILQILELLRENIHALPQELIREATAEKAENIDILFNIGIECAQNNRLAQAVLIFSELSLTKKGDAAILYNLGFIYSLLKEPREALKYYGEALKLDPLDPAIYINQGATFNELKQYEEAIQSLNQAVALNPNIAEAWSNKGTALNELKRYEDALAHYDKALELNPQYVEAWSNKGVTLAELKRHEEALAHYDKALEINPQYLEAWANKGVICAELKRYEAASQCFERVLNLNPNFAFGKGALLHDKMSACDWKGLDGLYRSICQDIRERKKSADPFGFQGICDDESLLQQCAEIFSNDKFPSDPQFNFEHLKRSGQKIRIGYLCGEFREQATAMLMTELWELHDKSQFEIVAFDNGWDDNSLRRKRIEAAFDEVIDISRMSDEQASTVIFNKEIDILLNLNGFFGKPRQGIFAKKPAPIQVNYLGFPGTIGASYMDYLIADRIVIPNESQQFYSEKIVQLPHCYQPNDSTRLIDGKQFSIGELGLPQEGFVFCCFNNSYKIHPQLFDLWMRLLHAVQGSVLWLIEDSPDARRHLQSAAQARGISPTRIIFAKRIPLPEHLARHQYADLFLDTLPYNAHTTASDALWAGLPVLTCTGTAFAGRVATSMLTALDMPELITSNASQYEALAHELATNPEMLQAIKAKLNKNLLSSPLFNANLIVKDIEKAYQAMHQRFQEGLPPEHIKIN
ncbi:tetratricopeptide repeat protein [Polynucleobacter sp. 15G-AUS-farblos]|uniref:O-linked N-acetylglucosamine transferase, SPINDLY family protein n=1 Tax=Polynucleobacter sp. 15G-AUS-farblos TaxID=2689094 RepID=UPI001C0C77CC|nr:tetratricopeptide repeat protein [Polynucleobacter sp. 15G-AUS-farblos]MBU3583931.1 tetratricopeptide repeat protein [Polynucleobacter sp. 15G-AUS-farblos]